MARFVLDKVTILNKTEQQAKIGETRQHILLQRTMRNEPADKGPTKCVNPGADECGTSLRWTSSIWSDSISRSKHCPIAGSVFDLPQSKNSHRFWVG